MQHLTYLLAEQDSKIRKLLDRQITQEGDPRYGGFWQSDFHVEPRACGFYLSEMIASYVTAKSELYLDASLAESIKRTLVYMKNHQRPDGCYDLSGCNFASPPDTAFMINAVLNGWWLLEKCSAPEADFIRQPLYELIDSSASGIATGGFHTPNHRWAIASCLLHCAKITGRQELATRAEDYLREGLDINDDGEFAERSAGNYNQVNDDQMIRLYLATKDEQYLDAAAKNLEMMYCYFDPDETIFTNNSTRQDLGLKLYADSYYILFLLVGYLKKREDFGAMAEWIYQNARKRGTSPGGIEWLLLFPDMDGFGAASKLMASFTCYDRMFKDSDIARVRHGDYSYTLLKGKPNFLYFQHGAFSMYMTLYGNICDKRNFIADSLEKTETGYTMRSHAEGWYYLPFPEKPSTSDWWAMDNATKRPMTQGLPLDTTIEIVNCDEGIDLHIKTEGIDQMPMRLEFAFLAGGTVRTEHFVQAANAGQSITILDGEVEAASIDDETIVIGPAFGEHNVQKRMGDAYPFSDSHYTVYFTAYTPVDRVVHIRAARKDRHL